VGNVISCQEGWRRKSRDNVKQMSMRRRRAKEEELKNGWTG